MCKNNPSKGYGLYVKKDVLQAGDYLIEFAG